MSELPPCREVHALLPELAAGVAAGDDRAWALAHVAQCRDCRRELSQLTTAADAVLLLAPCVDPPPRFESRVLARLDAAPAPPPRRRLLARRRVAAALAFAVSVLVAAGGGALFVQSRTAEDRRLADQYRQTLAVANGRYLKAVALTTADARPAGTVFLYQGNPSWLLVAVTAAPADGAYRALAVDRAGAAHPVGTCQVVNGTGTIGYRLRLAVANISQIRLQSTDAVLTGTL
ncbi:zf-HC2 domain-containing protein [Micromonospora echinaurantiaca]|uniref:zf-HC2 domain-containing protein n=1 Tax=Micromonospora echinaurantiaca TaxID=47857 RepID=UPI0037987673